MNTEKNKVMPKIQFNHLGICVTDLPKMEQFYCEVLGMVVTDRGNALGCDLVFLSLNPEVHHQIVLGSGRPKELPGNTQNEMFGPCINQISFQLDTFQELRAMKELLEANYEADYIHANHGQSWSIYFHDPEGNMLEIFVESEWYIKQPVFEPLDYSKSDEEIFSETLELCNNSEDFQPFEDWRVAISKKMGVIYPR